MLGIDVQFLYDTGASCTILSSQMWMKIPPKQRPKLQFSDLKLTSVANQVIPVWGKATLQTEIVEWPITWEIQVVEIAEEAVLGLDLMSALKCQWDWQGDKVIILGSSKQCDPGEDQRLQSEEMDGQLKGALSNAEPIEDS